ncbi:hypothetical protein I0Q12_11035 [Rhodococcus sp. CX]|uniref:hypothetical protein n=1 Tax=Rhodococcus sp. CX TaxID=2789880 RepID=UPI0018CCF540|nr:hypothetical protein [Rhodococcus sp. CX]MBH0120020.1 hypothetical protein [Rhodococcus sp. CX]
MAVLTYSGIGSVVTFDDVAGTVTFADSRWGLPRRQRLESAWVVPVGAIEGISWREATSSRPAEMRLLLRGRVGYHKNSRADPSYVAGHDRIGDFVAAINSAVQTAEPISDFGKDLEGSEYGTAPLSIKKRIGIGAVAVVAVLGLAGSCLNNNVDTEATVPNSTIPKASAASSPTFEEEPVWTGTVQQIVAASGGSGGVPSIIIDAAGRQQRIDLANIRPFNCGDYSWADSPPAVALFSRVRELLPVGTQVRAVRDMVSSVYPGVPLPTGAYVSVVTASTQTTSAPAATPTSASTPAPTTVSSTTTSSQTPTPSGSDSTESPAPAAAPDDTINALLVSEGVAEPSPSVDLSPFATAPVDEQIASAKDSLGNVTARRYWPGMYAAFEAAWEGRIGRHAECRARDDRRLLEQQQQGELDRIRRGLDGVYGTDDDDRNTYKFDDDGNLYLDTPYVPPTPHVPSTSGGGGGGGFNLCRRWWC